MLVGWVPIVWISINVSHASLLISSTKDEAKEIERLENIVIDVQVALDEGEYKHALRIAESIDYQRYDIEAERKWDIEREYWVDKVIEEASENGVTLDYKPTKDVDNANDDAAEEETSSGGFVEGFKEGLHSNDEEIQNNIDQFKENLNGGSSSENKDEN